MFIWVNSFTSTNYTVQTGNKIMNRMSLVPNSHSLYITIICLVSEIQVRKGWLKFVASGFLCVLRHGVAMSSLFFNFHVACMWKIRQFIIYIFDVIDYICFGLASCDCEIVLFDLMLNILGKQLRSYWDGQLLKPRCSWTSLLEATVRGKRCVCL